MEVVLTYNNKLYQIDLSQGMDISIPLHGNLDQVNCFYAPLFSSEPVKMGSFIGSVAQGGPVNFRNVRLNPHGNGTHTEGVGHISAEMESVNGILKNFHFFTQLISIYPTLRENGDRVIEKQTLEIFMDGLENVDSIVIRTLPNDPIKRSLKYSGTNPTYIAPEAMELIISKNIQHVLVDIPSVDREEDGGVLASHNLFWSGERKKYCTITELIYVPDHIKDGLYLLNLQVAAMELDAVPSRPVLYKLHEQ